MPGPDHVTRSAAALPARQLGEAELAALRAPYTELIGLVPPRIQARTELGSRLDPELLRLQEAVRLRAMYPACFDVKTSQLMLFGILLALMGDAARLHAVAPGRSCTRSWGSPISSGGCPPRTWARRSCSRWPRPRATRRRPDASAGPARFAARRAGDRPPSR